MSIVVNQYKATWGTDNGEESDSFYAKSKEDAKQMFDDTYRSHLMKEDGYLIKFEKIDYSKTDISYKYVVGSYRNINGNMGKKISDYHYDKTSIKSIYEVEKEAKADHRGDCICRVDVIYILHKDTIVGVLDKESA